jgi:hypothetical protein
MTKIADKSIKYGLSHREYLDMLIKQQNECRICSSLMKRPNIDHDHKTGKVRGILCNLCNKGLGQFKDNHLLLEKTTKYLLENK